MKNKQLIESLKKLMTIHCDPTSQSHDERYYTKTDMDNIFWYTGLKKYTTIINLTDTSVYSEDTWYPVNGEPFSRHQAFQVTAHLNISGTPSWATHANGFYCDLDLINIASGWGTTNGEITVLNNEMRFVKDGKHPAIFVQNYQSSVPIWYLRGGGRYEIVSSVNMSWTPHTDAYVSKPDDPLYRVEYPATTNPPKTAAGLQLSTMMTNIDGTASNVNGQGIIYGKTHAPTDSELFRYQGLQLRENELSDNAHTNDIHYAPGITFNWKGATASTMVMNALGNFVFFRSNGVNRATIDAIFQSSSADYAELFEYEDGNTNNNDRVGLFVTMKGDKITLAQSEDDYILGVISGNPSMLGNAADNEWSGKVLCDDFGRTLYEKTNTTEDMPILNPDYDPDLIYIPRTQRPEWDAVGMIGVLSVIDDGTCVVDGYCTASKNGIATFANNEYELRGGGSVVKHFRVIKRVSKNVIKIVFR